jgi:predicted lipoprotein with Yx(FWY)xxD motif
MHRIATVTLTLAVAALAVAGCGSSSNSGSSSGGGSSGGSSTGSSGTASSGSGGGYGGYGGYGGGQSSTSSSSSAAAAGAVTVKAQKTKLGTILVGSNGHTLYLFEKDTGAASTCAGACASEWPPLTTKGAPKAVAGLKASMLSTHKRSDGTTQVLYGGHPLYYFAGDQSSGQANGEGLNFFGGAWYAVGPSGHKVASGAS